MEQVLGFCYPCGWTRWNHWYWIWLDPYVAVLSFCRLKQQREARSLSLSLFVLPCISNQQTTFAIWDAWLLQCDNGDTWVNPIFTTWIMMGLLHWNIGFSWLRYSSHETNNVFNIVCRICKTLKVYKLFSYFLICHIVHTIMLLSV